MTEPKLFFNNTINKKELKKIITWAFTNHGYRKAAYFIDQLKGLGFKYATNSGISISLEDLRVPPIKKNLMLNANKTIYSSEAEASNGIITEVERFQKIIYIWSLTSETLKDRLIRFFKDQDPLNSVYMMAFSGARGNIDQVRQLVGMRGLMSDPNGQIIDQAIATNFREGLSITDYIISSYGARKGIVDTAIKTADSGYLTRRLVEITQNIIISELDCKTQRGIILEIPKLIKSNNNFSIYEKLFGRVLGTSLIYKDTLIGLENQPLTNELIEEIVSLKIDLIKIRSPLTCFSRRSVCQKCYGLNMASGELVDLGETIGLVAAQSIGEPGTQLTMRTFHTGGIFTSELTRQSRANCTGYVRFLLTDSLKSFRTQYGQDAHLSERESFLRIINYFNQIIELKIESRTVILAENYACIKIDDILFEAAPIANDRSISQKEIKYIIAERSGELILESNGFLDRKNNYNFKKRTNKNFIFWVLSGQVFNIPFGSNIKARKFQRSFKDQAISQTKVITTVPGFIHITRSNTNDGIRTIKIQNFFKSLKTFQFFIEKNFYQVEKCKIYLSLEYDITLNPTFNRNKLRIGFLNNKNYRTKTGGKFYSFYLPGGERENNGIKRKKQFGYTVFFVPESTVQTVCKKKQFKVKNGSYAQKGSEIFPYYIANFAGFVSYDNDKTIKTVTIIPGKRYFLRENLIKTDFFSNRVYFSGEVFLNRYEISNLSYLRIVKSAEGFYFYFIPITRYEIIKEKQFTQSFFPSLNFNIEESDFRFKSGQSFKTDNSIQFVSYSITLDYPFDLINTEVVFGVHAPSIKSGSGQLHLGTSQTLVLERLLPKGIKKSDIKTDLLVENKQFVEAYTTIAYLNVIMPWTDFVFEIKTKPTVKNPRLFLTTTADYKTIFFEDFNHFHKRNSLSKIDRTFRNNLKLKESGVFKKILGNYFSYQLAHPYLFSQGAIIRKLPGDFIKKQESLGQLIYERLKTGDIIQGLPKVDEILEVRKPKSEALLAITPGIFININKNTQKIFITLKPNLEINTYDIPRTTRLLVKKFQYICIGQPLTEGRINPHSLLQIYFRYFFSLGTLSVYESAYRSITKVRTLILKSIQAIYISQGVSISDKHIELIVTEITKKVYIEHPGNTDFLPGDIIDLDQANYINTCLEHTKNILYRPILLGITKSSLKMDGFLAAASFQETTRVLTQAAIEGKMDWLQGLKENAITGRLIPAGTGFYINQDILYNHVLVPNSINPLNLINSIKNKQILIKKTIKFKYKKNHI